MTYDGLISRPDITELELAGLSWDCAAHQQLSRLSEIGVNEIALSSNSNHGRGEHRPHDPGVLSPTP